MMKVDCKRDNMGIPQDLLIRLDVRLMKLRTSLNLIHPLMIIIVNFIIV